MSGKKQRQVSLYTILVVSLLAVLVVSPYANASFTKYLRSVPPDDLWKPYQGPPRGTLVCSMPGVCAHGPALRTRLGTKLDTSATGRWNA
jgi:hypothetical protein